MYRFLNKACLIKDPEKDIAPDGSATNPWNLCTAQEVEELKAIIKVIPLWSTGIMMSVNANQGSFPLLQAKSFNRHITKNFEIPAGTMGVLTIFAIFLWVGIYDRIILPIVSKIKGRQVRIGAKYRIGIGLFFYFISFPFPVTHASFPVLILSPIPPPFILALLRFVLGLLL